MSSQIDAVFDLLDKLEANAKAQASSSQEPPKNAASAPPPSFFDHATRSAPFSMVVNGLVGEMEMNFGSPTAITGLPLTHTVIPLSCFASARSFAVLSDYFF